MMIISDVLNNYLVRKETFWDCFIKGLFDTMGFYNDKCQETTKNSFMSFDYGILVSITN